MMLRDQLKTMRGKERAKFAARCGTTLGHLTNVAYGYRSCAEALAIAIERETKGVVTVEELRPDVDWAVIRGKPAATAEQGRAA